MANDHLQSPVRLDDGTNIDSHDQNQNLEAVAANSITESSAIRRYFINTRIESDNFPTRPWTPPGNVSDKSKMTSSYPLCGPDLIPPKADLVRAASPTLTKYRKANKLPSGGFPSDVSVAGAGSVLNARSPLLRVCESLPKIDLTASGRKMNQKAEREK